LYEQNHEFPKRTWLASYEPAFEFNVPDTLATYTLYCNVRNSLDYPFSRIFVNYQLIDSTGQEVSRNLVSNFLFDQKTGRPAGESGLGDLYDHRFPLLEHFRFRTGGKYTVRLSQFMRLDTLSGVLAVGLRVEKDNTEMPNPSTP